MPAVTKAIILVAGFGTRRLPITKAIEKSMLPIGDRPIVDYTVEDCLKAGITDITFVVSEDAQQIRTYYGKNASLEVYLAERNKPEMLEMVQGIAAKAHFEFVVQGKDLPYGTAVPVSLCADIIRGKEQVIVATGDDFPYSHDGRSEVGDLIAGTAKAGATAGLMTSQVAWERVSKSGVIDFHDNKLFKRIVESPPLSSAPSNHINISRYLFDTKMMDFTRQVMASPPAANGEYQLTEALRLYAEAGLPLAVVPIHGVYLDGGTQRGWLEANNYVLSST